jgi:hypothetical protein
MPPTTPALSCQPYAAGAGAPLPRMAAPSSCSSLHPGVQRHGHVSASHRRRVCSSAESHPSPTRIGGPAVVVATARIRRRTHPRRDSTAPRRCPRVFGIARPYGCESPSSLGPSFRGAGWGLVNPERESERCQRYCPRRDDKYPEPRTRPQYRNHHYFHPARVRS